MSDEHDKGDSNEVPLLSKSGIDVSSWEPALPPKGFAERLAKLASKEAGAPRASNTSGNDRSNIVPFRWPARSRFALGAVGVCAMAAAAAMLALRLNEPSNTGNIAADHRMETSISNRAVAVLEDGSALRWDASGATQEKGDIFYRVNPGGTFSVLARGMKIEVKGTCFRIQVKEQDMQIGKKEIVAAGVGATLAALVTVGVFEGTVIASSGKQTMTLKAGESAALSKDGALQKMDSEGRAIAAENEDPTLRANATLSETVKSYRQKLDSIEAEKKELSKKLETTEAKLAETESKGNGGKPKKNEFDLTKEELNEMADNGKIAIRTLCKDPWKPEQAASVEKKLGLSPDDRLSYEEAYRKTSEQVWTKIRPLCLEVLGNKEIVDKLGADGCSMITRDLLNVLDGEGSGEAAVRDVANIRAGRLAAPAKPSRGVRLLLALGDSDAILEKELASRFGPEEGHRLTFEESGVCMNRHRTGVGPAPKK